MGRVLLSIESSVWHLCSVTSTKSGNSCRRGVGIMNGGQNSTHPRCWCIRKQHSVATCAWTCWHAAVPWLPSSSLVIFIANPPFRVMRDNYAVKRDAHPVGHIWRHSDMQTCIHAQSSVWRKGYGDNLGEGLELGKQTRIGPRQRYDGSRPLLPEQFGRWGSFHIHISKNCLDLPHSFPSLNML